MGSNSAKNPQKRRVPVQARSRRRYDRIVDGAAELFADQGFDGTTMEAIAGRAETSIGSVYQFFPNKLAVFRAVAERCMARSGVVFAELFAGDALMDPHSVPWERLVDAAIDGFAGFHAREPSFKAVLANIHLYGEYADDDEALMREFAAQLGTLIGVWAPWIGDPKREQIATMLVQTTSAMLVVTSRQHSPALARGLLDETKIMLKRYMAPYLRSPDDDGT